VIIDAQGLKGTKSDFANFEDAAASLGFVRWQWEYTRATYDLKYEDKSSNSEFYLRVNVRVESGKLESPYAILSVEDSYMGKVTFPHGLDYEAPIPESIVRDAGQKLKALKQQITH
jgi:hypothetical protein